MNRNDMPTVPNPVHPPKLRVGRLVVGLVLCVVGVLLIPTVALSAVGIAACVVGVLVLFFAFASSKYGAAHTGNRASQDEHTVR